MKMRYLAATGLLVALAACGGTAGNEANVAGNAVDAPAANSAEPAPAQATTAAADLSTMSQAYIVGSWGEGADCADPLEFKADGTMGGSMFDGERWRLEGNQLIMVGNPNALTVTRIDDNHMTTANTQGRTVTVTRCTGGAPTP
jgi:hypothetical protein